MSGLTKQQNLASDPRSTVWVGASAGTGKTHVLTARVLRLMLKGNDPAKILCLTYTKAAAAEMKNRIFKTLGRWAIMDDMALSVAIYDATGEKADDIMLQAARQLFASVLDLPGGLKIQTIHSFCQSILSRFPLEAALTPGFEVSEEGESYHLMRRARDDVFSNLNTLNVKDMRAATERVALRTTEDTFDAVMAALIGKADVLHKLLVRYKNAAGVSTALRTTLGLDKDISDEDIIRDAVRDDSFDQEGLNKVAEAFAGAAKTIATRGKAIAAFLAANEVERLSQIEAYMDAFLTKAREGRSDAKTKVLKDDPSLYKIVEAEKLRLIELHRKRVTLELAENTSALLHVGFEILKQYERVKLSRGKLDFNDIINHTEVLFGKAGIAPWILFKLDEGIDHILVDEAQDTNKQQWTVIETLASEFYALPHEGEAPRTLFAVGDPKQSIYSFQKAEPREFVAAKSRVFDRAADAAYPHSAIPLDESFRTSEAVLTVVDKVFDKDTGAYSGLTFDDEAIAHKFARKGQGGKVELWPLVEADESISYKPWEPPVVQETGQETSEKLAKQIALAVRERLDAGALMPATKRPLSAGDIMVLVQRRSIFTEYLVSAFKKQGIPVAGRDRMRLDEELVIEDLIALTEFALQPEDDLTLATIIKSPLIGLGEDDLFALAYDRGAASLWSQLKANEDYADARHFLARILTMADQTPVYEFYATILTELEGRQRFINRLGEEVNDPIDEFLQLTMLFESENPPSLQGFLQYFRESSSEIKRDMEQSRDEVRIMTVHGAKGLQAPLVILPDTVRYPAMRDSLLLWQQEGEDEHLLWKVGPNMRQEPHVQELTAEVSAKIDAEYRRLLYVAMTRAEDQLIVCGWETQRATNDNCWYRLIENAFDHMGVEGEEIRNFEIAQTEPLTQQEISSGIKPEYGPLPDWVMSIPEAEALGTRPLIPSQLEDEEPTSLSPLATSNAHRFKRGTIIHTLLEFLPDLTEEAREDAALGYLSQVSLELSADDQQQIWSEVKAIITDPTFAPLFGENSRAEVGITGLVGDDIISGQVDRVVILDNRVLVVDYKTNRPAPTESSRIPSAYIKQMRAYARALKNIYPNHVVEAAILWTDKALLMPIPADKLT